MANHPSGDDRNFLAAVVVLLVLVAAVLAGAFLLDGDDDEDEVATGATTTSVVPATTEPPTSTTTPAPEAVGIWPVWDAASREEAADDPRFSDPTSTAEAFAREYLGMTTPVAGEVREEEPRAVEIDIRPNDQASVTTTLDLRQLGDDGPWTVVAAQSDQIIVDEPEVLAEISSPVHVSGRALAFEGHVNVEVRQDGMTFGEALGEGFVTGSGVPPPGPFEGDIEFDEPTEDHGALVFYEPSAKDGSTVSATVIPVTFAAG